jgi:hypothetical protein
MAIANSPPGTVTRSLHLGYGTAFLVFFSPICPRARAHASTSTCAHSSLQSLSLSLCLCLCLYLCLCLCLCLCLSLSLLTPLWGTMSHSLTGVRPCSPSCGSHTRRRFACGRVFVQACVVSDEEYPHTPRPAAWIGMRACVRERHWHASMCDTQPLMSARSHCSRPIPTHPEKEPSDGPESSRTQSSLASKSSKSSRSSPPCRVKERPWHRKEGQGATQRVSGRRSRPWSVTQELLPTPSQTKQAEEGERARMRTAQIRHKRPIRTAPSPKPAAGLGQRGALAHPHLRMLLPLP